MGPGPDPSGSALVIQDIDDDDISVGLYWASQTNQFIFDFGNIQSETFSSKNTFPAGSFYYVAATYDGSTFRLLC
jgi:Concanavalin A-like lectin/glucanases superfamily